MAVMQKALMGQCMTMSGINSTGGFFLLRSNSMCVNLDTKIDAAAIA
jgi:hypothetical protein